MEPAGKYWYLIWSGIKKENSYELFKIKKVMEKRMKA